MSATGFNWSDLIGPAITGGVALTGSLLSNSLAQDKAKEDKRAAADDRAYLQSQSQLEHDRAKELINLRASLAGGPPKPFLGFTDPQRVSAIQQQDQNNLAAIQQLILAYQRGLGRAG